MKKIKILYLITSLDKGGAETQLFRLVSNLKKKKDIELKVVSIKGGYFEEKLKEEGIDVEIISNNLSYFKLPQYISKLKKIIKEFKPNIVHSFLFHTNILMKISLFFMKKDFKLITSYRADIRDFKLLYFLEKVNKNNVDLAISNTNAAFIGMNKLFKKSKKLVISNGIDISKSAKIKPNLQLGKKLKNKKIILTVANFRDEKDYRTNVLTCQELLKTRQDFCFIYIGTGPKQNEIKKLVSDLNLEKVILFLNRREDILQIMKISNVFFLPTKCEGQSNVMLEAMSMKLPIVTTNIEAVLELGGELFLSEPEDNISMAKNINNILLGKYDKKILIKNYTHVKKNYSIKSMVDGYYREYLEMFK